ncbi:type II toxin-antitoxin system PemK/MazF family toxin [Paracraurococcus lichenis]|uniref:Type II toxin-antitoxin system PemK/MazF family toxin n=1 Tax=Paracraurococcus lichenis TaxID=3064888 RepID=A0ABT9E254_9PROT|nr:type II toxin-antitoxin system PemK/MazF family toxin [Paracraurococcus sp. LOR1-02]MDO9710223.1 type II toxin-antitoxin system PemK/MazF family toxin [Paracraurococcus sp. LOR1-02]
MSLALRAGQIVIADWRDALPKEPNRLRPAIVVEDSELFDPAYPNVLLVPITEDSCLGIPDLSVPIAPTPENGCTKLSYALATHVTATSKARVRPTESQVAPDLVAAIRARIGIALGLG